MTRATSFLLLVLSSFGLISYPIPASAGNGAPRVLYRGLLTPQSLPDSYRFGSSVELFGTYAVVSTTNSSFGWSGPVYVFDFSNPRDIRELAVLRSPAADAYGFGDSLAITDRYLFIGDSHVDEQRGAVYMYELANLDAKPLKISVPDAHHLAYFGHFLAADGNRLLVGAPSFPGTESPAAYIIDFTDPSNLTQLKLLPNDGETAGFGRAGDISDDYVIVNQPYDSSRSEDTGGPYIYNGAAYLYEISDPNRLRHKKLFAADTHYNGFGESVAIDGDVALVGVQSDPGPGSNAGNRDGAVWSFDLSDSDNLTQVEFGRPTPQTVFDPSPPPPFGSQLSFANSMAVIGAFNEDKQCGAV